MRLRLFMAGVLGCALAGVATAGMSFSNATVNGVPSGPPEIQIGDNWIDFFLTDAVAMGSGGQAAPLVIDFSYEVAAADGYLLSGVWNTAAGAIFGGAEIHIAQEIRDADTDALLQSNAYLLDADNEPPITELVMFGPAERVVVSKHIELIATDLGDLAALTLIEDGLTQQVIPTPASAALGLLGLGMIARRRRA